MYDAAHRMAHSALPPWVHPSTKFQEMTTAPAHWWVGLPQSYLAEMGRNGHTGAAARGLGWDTPMPQNLG